MLVLTRATVALAQPPFELPISGPAVEQLAFWRFCLHLREQLDLLLRSSSDEEMAATATISATTAPTDIKASYQPARWLLLSCYEAAHALERVSPGRREAACIALLAKLTGDARLLDPSADASLAVYNECAAIYRRAGQLCATRPTRRKAEIAEREALLKSLGKWLLGMPENMAPKSILARRKISSYEPRRPCSERAAARAFRRPAATSPVFGSALASNSIDSNGRGPLGSAERGMIAFFAAENKAPLALASEAPPL